MALRSEACIISSGGESSGSEAGSSCLQFGVRSYLHQFYEECSSSVLERDSEDRGLERRRATLWWGSAVWKVSLALGLLMLTAGIVGLSVGYSTPHKIESFGEGDLFFVDTEAISFNRGLHMSTGAGTALSCLGSALVVMGVAVWVFPKSNLKETLFHLGGEGERRGELGSKWKIHRDLISEPPGMEAGKIPSTVSKVETVQPTS
ncbi:neurensin 1-like [Brachionichthys hirsutus]|uniref:neurensin 1-like n=1 Tax=Brachionichthys hirsutus TaxID=412623 RepID=UPI0036053DE2